MKTGEARRVQTLLAGAIKALERAVVKAIAAHKSVGVPAAIWRNRKSS